MRRRDLERRKRTIQRPKTRMMQTTGTMTPMETWAAMGIPPSPPSREEEESDVGAAAGCEEELMLEDMGFAVSDVKLEGEDGIAIPVADDIEVMSEVVDEVIVGVVCATVELIKAVVVVVVGTGMLLGIKVFPVMLGLTQ